MAKTGQRKHGIKRGERFAMIPEKVAHSEAFCSLTASAHRLLVLALTKYHGNNNGDITLTKSELKAYRFTCSDTLNRALKELLNKGLLVLTKQGGFGMGHALPNLYAIGWLDIPECKKLDIDTPAIAINGWATWKTKPSTGLPEQTNSDSCVPLTPIRAAFGVCNTGLSELANSGLSDTSLRSSPEGHPPMAAKAGSGGLEAGGQ